jgi:hypothetical protein
MAKVKVQIMLPDDMVNRIEEDCKDLFLKKSSWFERAVHLYFKENIDEKDKKKKIDLDI